jgi:hypothetical protein
MPSILLSFLRTVLTSFLRNENASAIIYFSSSREEGMLIMAMSPMTSKPFGRRRSFRV